jgi:hypothetical protein
VSARFERPSTAPPEAVWPLLARPARWHEWAPHVRGAWGLGSPEVEAGRTGVVRALGLLPVPARIECVDPGRSWRWEVAALVRMDHRVESSADGTTVVLELSAPGPLEPALALAYGPVIGWALERLARLACAG